MNPMKMASHNQLTSRNTGLPCMPSATDNRTKKPATNLTMCDAVILSPYYYLISLLHDNANLSA